MIRHKKHSIAMRKIPISLFQTQKSTDKHTNNIKNVFFLFISFALSFFLFTTAPKRTIYEYAKTSSKSKDMSLLNVWRKPSYRWTHVITAESSMKIGQWAHFFFRLQIPTEFNDVNTIFFCACLLNYKFERENKETEQIWVSERHLFCDAHSNKPSNSSAN